MGDGSMKKLGKSPGDWFDGSVLIMVIEYSPGEFIYTTKAAETMTSSPSESSPQSDTNNMSLTKPVDPFASLSPEQRSLLHHFINDASQITACHSGMQNNICKMLIPMALQTPSLLYATTALSAIHLQALNNQSESVKTAPDIARYMALSLEHFRTELQNPRNQDSDALLATARTLCLAEIHSGAIHPNSWRAHIEGAKALMTTSKNGRQTDGFRWYLDRWYRSIVSLTALTANGPPIGEGTGGSSAAEVSNVVSQPDSPDYLDDYWGFTVHLSAIFRGIGAAAWRDRQSQESGLIFDGNVETDAAILESSVHCLMDRGADGPPTFYPGVGEGLSAACIGAFMLCNEAFQHSALIQIERRLRRAPTSSPLVQASVKRILDCTMQIGPSAGLSPWVMLTTPLFIAGCEAQGEDRDTVRHLLASLYDTIRVPNVLQSLKFLEQYWGQARGEEDWSHFLGMSDGEGVDVVYADWADRMNFDFIPY